MNTGNISTGSSFADDTYIYAGGIAGYANYATMHTSHNENKNISVTSGDLFGSLCGIIGDDKLTFIYDCCTSLTLEGLRLIGGDGQITPDYQEGHIKQ